MSDRLFAATRKGLFTIERSANVQGARWKIVKADFLGDNAPMVCPDAKDNAVYVGFGHGHWGVKMQRSRDGGATWEECAVPAYPEKPEGVEDIDPIQKKPIPWSTAMIWALEADHRDGARLWCGTIPGGLFVSHDRGSSWSLIRTLWDHPKRKEWFGGGAELPGLHSICLDPREPRRVTVAVSCGGVWVTGDRGETWNCRADGIRAAYVPPEEAMNPNIQDVHHMVQCWARPDVFWAQHHNGVFRSTDNCKSWHEIMTVSPSVFGFAVAVHPEDPDTAWFLPAVKDETRIPVEGKVVVARTRDGGKSFDVLRNGLPQEHAYDLTLRHGLDVDETGERLAFGTTTGSLWVSEDQGDSWQTVSEHLPPVYCVRFMK